MEPWAKLVTGPLAEEVWRRLIAAANERAHPMHLIAMATCGVDCVPAVRMMTLRGADTGRLWFHTDRRTPKVSELKNNPAVSLMAFDPRDGVQLRLGGRAEVLDHGPEVERHWAQTTMIIRHLYSSEEAPGEAAGAPDPRVSGQPGALSAALTRRARSNFAVIEVGVDVIDWFQIMETRHTRAVLRAATGWRTEYVTVTA